MTTPSMLASKAMTLRFLSLLILSIFAFLVSSIHLVTWSSSVSLSAFVSTSATANVKSNHLTATGAINSATGRLFKGEVVESFPQSEIQFLNFDPEFNHEPESIYHSTPKTLVCENWSVVTTIFAPSEAVKRAAKVYGWCIVIVADTKTPKNYLELGGFQGMKESVHYLSVEYQQEWLASEMYNSSAVGEFLNAIPFGHFARKNIGFLYAIQKGAKIIFDFDDDNLLPSRSDGDVISPLEAANIAGGHEQKLTNVRQVSIETKVFNHHPLMGAKIKNSWARGFPLENIQNGPTQGTVVASGIHIDTNSIGVMQFCANGNPDIDAIHRLIHPLPMTFEKTENVRADQPLNVPIGSFAPYNAQATLHTQKALWALFLPFTVPGRVSDIWRGYFAEVIFSRLGLSVNFLPPSIVQDRNEHQYLADMQAELDLYFKAGVLIDYLTGWNSTAKSIPEMMEHLWIDMYERNYIGKKDVNVLQLWLRALMEVGYCFPSII